MGFGNSEMTWAISATCAGIGIAVMGTCAVFKPASWAAFAISLNTGCVGSSKSGRLQMIDLKPALAILVMSAVIICAEIEKSCEIWVMCMI